MQIEISAGTSAAENVGICFLRCFYYKSKAFKYFG